MDTDPPDRDQALLERLNALRKSSVSLETISDPLQQSPRDVTNITARFRNLKSDRKTDPNALITSIAEAPTAVNDTPPSPTVEELLADLGPEEQWKLDQNETAQLHTLLKEAKEALPTSEGEGEENHPSTQGSRNSNLQKGAENPTESRRTSTTSSANDEEEAARQLQRILDELDLSTVSDSLVVEADPLPTHPHHPPSLPSTPQTDPPKPPHEPSTTDNNNNNNNNPTNNLFPSVPATLPVRKTDGFTDAEISSWCIICCADAVVRCTGCAGDLYCWGCWGEGHRGEGAGWEEMGHGWVGVGGWKGREGGRVGRW
ncbi:MAG: hypothetical protein Q9182_006726 [Xanthomendoza sp. 2 TL-2023]